MKNWKTTLCFAIAGIAGMVATSTDPSMAFLAPFAKLVAPFFTFLGGYFAKDSNVTGGTTPQ